MSLHKPVCYILLNDEDLLSINRQALQHDYYTDIITFDFSDDPDYTHHEIYISLDRVEENSTKHQTSFTAELLRVCIHGLLHLGGYDDKTPEQIEKIRAAEDAYLDLSRST